MLQETMTHQDDTTNNTKFFKKKITLGKVFGRLTIRWKNIRKKNDKKIVNPAFCNDASDIEEDQLPRLTVASSSTKTSTTSVSSSTSSVTPLPNTAVSQPVASTLVISFSDDDQTSTGDSSSKSASLFSHLNNSSVLRRKASATSESFTITSSEENMLPSNNGQRATKFPKKNLRFNRKMFGLSSLSTNCKLNGNLHNNHSTVTLNSSVNEGSNSDDSAYETEQEVEICCVKQNKKSKKSQKKPQENKTIKKTKLTTLSSKDPEYIEIQDRFRAGPPLQNKKIHGIIRLQMPTKLVNAHEQYKKQIARQHDLPESKVCHRMFHGTKSAVICKPQNFVKYAMYCRFGLGCGVCGIIQEGNRTKYSHYTQRMWFANSSATSLSYCSSSKVKAMFLVDVISPSSNSILIVDKDEATIPRYLIVFQ